MHVNRIHVAPLFQLLCAFLAVVIVCVPSNAADDVPFDFLVGRAIRDITGPAVGVQMFGFVRADQISEGIHLRQRARTFIIAERDGARRVVLVTADLGSVTNEIQREVVDRLERLYPGVYGKDNVLISATHTHAGPAGYWHYGANTPLGSPFYGEYFAKIVAAIVSSITAAHENLQPAAILINRGRVEEAGAQRSARAYLNNPQEERDRYDSDTDKEMTLLKFVSESGEIGSLNWFAVHPTSMTYNNRLISGDHKGYAAFEFERRRGTHYDSDDDFVAAFAQSNCGDVTSNLNLNNTGPGKDDFESTRIIGERQLAEAVRLFRTANEPLAAKIDYRHRYVDFSTLTVGDEYTHAGEQRTAPSAYGYAFAAGSTEDGGGHPLFKEGMTERNPFIDGLVRGILPIPPPSDELRALHLPKAILAAPGGMDPPGQAQVQPLGIVTIGQLVLVAGPAEFTTMSGRRIREAVAATIGEGAKYVVIAGYTNGYSGYVTTREEYQVQHYEGGHTLFGPWTQAGYQQEFVRLAKTLADDMATESGPDPREVRGTVESTPLGTEFDRPPQEAKFGDVMNDAAEKYAPGDVVEVTFWTGHPQNGFATAENYVSIERNLNGAWSEVARDGDWSTRCRWTQPGAEPEKPKEPADTPQTKPPADPLAAPTKKLTPDAHLVKIQWTIPLDVSLGEYRIVHLGTYRDQESGKVGKVTGKSRAFQVD